MFTAAEKIDFNFALKVQIGSWTFWNLSTGGSLGVGGCCRNCCSRSPILANLSQMRIFEQGDDRHSFSTTSVRCSQQPEKPSYSHPNLLPHELVIVNGKLFS